MKEIIKQYLDERAKQDELFASSYAKENKSLEECIKYIENRAKELAKGAHCVAVKDAEVFGWAVHYYDEDDIVIEPKREPCSVSTSAPTPTPVKKKKSKKQNDAQLSFLDEL